MKSKKISRKLVLSKQTIANIDYEGMNVIKGGETLHPRDSCPGEICMTDGDITCETCTCNPTMCPGSCHTTICA